MLRGTLNVHRSRETRTCVEGDNLGAAAAETGRDFSYCSIATSCEIPDSHKTHALDWMPSAPILPCVGGLGGRVLSAQGDPSPEC